MSQLFAIKKVCIDSEKLSAHVFLSKEAPYKTSEAAEGTQKIVELFPQIKDHACIGDKGASFGEGVPDTDLGHLLEHITLELMSKASEKEGISSGRTRDLEDGRGFELELACPDDVLCAGALSSAVWILNWAYSNEERPRPDVEGIISGLHELLRSLSSSSEEDQNSTELS